MLHPIIIMVLHIVNFVNLQSDTMVSIKIVKYIASIRWHEHGIPNLVCSITLGALNKFVITKILIS